MTKIEAKRDAGTTATANGHTLGAWTVEGGRDKASCECGAYVTIRQFNRYGYLPAVGLAPVAGGARTDRRCQGGH